MSKSDYCLQKLGDPTKPETKNYLSIWRPSQDILTNIKAWPGKLYCYKSMPQYLEQALELVIIRGLQDQIKTFDGCFNVRPIRGTKNTWSIHSWGLAFDINAEENGLGKAPKLSPELVACFDMWFDWGGNFKRLDGMHFELKQEFI